MKIIANKKKLEYSTQIEHRNYYAYMQWEKILTEGNGPSPRYQHCAHYYKQLNSLCIFGGRGNSKDTVVLNDLYMLRLDNFVWIDVKIKGMQLGGRANFASWLEKSKLVIFGGVKEN